MGWLFAVALALQSGSSRTLLVALPPIALGHAASLGAVALLLGLASALVPPPALRLLTAAALLVFGLYKLLRYYRHPRWVGMRVGARELFAWSFLMATAHGAGLMAAPLLLALDAEPAAAHHAAHQAAAAAAADTTALWALALGVHTAALFAVMALVAWVVYRRLGLAVLRRGWVNFDLIWAVALLVSGALALLAAL
ncbi:MAG TPA: hypothetical protein VG370_01790 [Chloroflexota bacterium]|jgi:hypothetical protein|nr:hypothetical protein [Chloroflexota bacterium]